MLADEEWAEVFDQGMAAAIIDRQGVPMPEADAEAAAVREALRNGGWPAAREAMERPAGTSRAIGFWIVLRGEEAGKKVEIDATWTVAGQTAIKKVAGEYVLAENCVSGAEATRRLRELADRYDVSSKGFEQSGLLGLGTAAMSLDAPQGDAGTDVRVWPIERDSQGHKYRSYETVLPLLREAPMADWPLSGPRSARWLARFIKDNGGSPRLRTSRFVQDAKVPEGDRVRYEHAMLMEMLEAATIYDQIDISSLCSFELLARRVSVLEEAYYSNPKAPRFDGSEHLQGLGKRGAAIMPALTEYASKQMQSEAAIQKERRKAREEQALAKNGRQGLGWERITGSRVDVERAVHALNDIAGTHSEDCERPLSEQQGAVLRHLCERAAVCESSDVPIGRTEALAAVLHSDARYSADGGVVAPYEAGNVSLPAAAARVPELCDVLDAEHAGRFMRFGSEILRPEYERRELRKEGLVPKPYMDPALEKDERAYALFLKDLYTRGLIDWCLNAEVDCGLFFVPKKNNTLRMICDARPLNAMCYTPPSFSLPTGDAISRLQVPEGE
eukprot:6482725-Amphidinium_carterae.1